MMAHLRLGAVRDNGLSAALLSALKLGHGRQSAPSLSALAPCIRTVLTNRQPSGWI
ncbi:MAG: hypothetical protein K2I26_01045 [Paramuribaculum sp.]|nr:hypothetical protein [Paramuribaculum sp.]